MPPRDPNSPEARSARAYFDRILADFGLSQLGPIGQQLWDAYLQGASDEQIMIQMRQSNEYRMRFWGLVEARERGMQWMSEAHYIAMEKQYREVFQSYAVPTGFYDHWQDFQIFFVHNVSPQELNRRLQVYSRMVNEVPEEVKRQLRQWYIGDGDLIAYFIHPGRALPLLEKQMRAAETAGIAQRAGMRNLARHEAERLASMTPEEINQRIGMFIEASYGQPEETKAELARLYGITDFVGHLIDPSKSVGELQQRLRAASIGGLSLRTGFGRLSRSEAERLVGAGTTAEAFQQAGRDRSLIKEVLPGFETIDETFGRKTQIDILAGNQIAAEGLERKRSRRKAEFAGGGGVARTERGFSGLGTAES